MLTIGVLASGRGTDFQSIVDAVESGMLNVKIGVLICNVPGAYVIERAKKHGIPYKVIEHRKKRREDFEEEMIQELKKHNVELVVLAGFMRILTPHFLKAFPNKIINIHPALLPSFPGTHAQKDALEYGVKITGCTVHFVNEDVDGGPIILQKAVEVKENDTGESLAQRILEEEHKILPQAIKLYAEGKLKIVGRRVQIIEN